MARLLLPAVVLMNRLSYVQKFMLIGVLCLLPVVLTLYLLVGELDKKMATVEQERLGIAYNSAVRKMMEHLQQHRGMTNIYLNGDASVRANVLAMQKQIDADIWLIDEMGAKLGGRLLANERWEEIKAGWERLRFIETGQHDLTYTNQGARQQFDLHSVLIADMLHLVSHVASNSSSRGDDGQDSYMLMDIAVNRLLAANEMTGQARGIGAGAAARGDASDDERTRLAALAGMARLSLDDMASRIALSANADTKASIASHLRDLRIQSSLFFDTLHTEVIQTDRITIVPATLFELGSSAIYSGFKLYDIQAPLLDNMLKQRHEQLERDKTLVVGFSCAVFVLLIYLFAAFYKSVTGTVYMLKRVSRKIAGGELSARVIFNGKDELGDVGKAINVMADAFENMMNERKHYEQHIEYQAYYDHLTGLPNKIMFNRKLKHILAARPDDGKQLAVLLIDLDRFKLINDTLGHDGGDLLLKGVADRLQQAVQDTGFAYRMSGDEFLLVLPEAEGEDEALRQANHVLLSLQQPVLVHEQQCFVSASIGISLFPTHSEDVGKLVKFADIAMYHAKRAGRNNCRIYHSSMNAIVEERLYLEGSIRHALEHNEFELFYQPRYDIDKKQTLVAEALIRWMHPQLGVVMPGSFIPLAEESGLIVPLGEWALRTACLQYQSWKQQTNQAIMLAVNISVIQFQRADFVEMVRKIIAETDMDPAALELELTESVFVNDELAALDKLRELKQMGIRIYIDDFGKGFSSLSYLKQFPIDGIKIDRSFIQGVPGDVKDTAITKTIIALGRRLQISIVAEGVETEEQFQFLSARKCNEAQGFLISRPLPAADVLHRIKTMPFKPVQT